MAFECYVPRKFSRGSEAIIEQANSIIREYQELGFSLTLRQLYYQFVARDLIPNKQTEYKRLGSIINDARLAGLVDWEAIEDRTRFLRSYTTFDDPEDAVERAARNYIEDLWDRQPIRIEVWIEKDALIGVIEPVCGRWRLPYFACRGYASQSELYNAGKRLLDITDRGQRALVLHLGDHDPSGIDMTRDNDDRIQMFSFDSGIEIRRIALNMDQIRRYRPPPNPAKESDSRISGYLAAYGTRSSWELDALDPKVIDALIEAEVQQEFDPDQWESSVKTENANRRAMHDASSRWDEVERMLRGEGE